MFDLIIIGGGPAGTAAAVYASRKKIKTLMLVKDWGGQSVESLGIQNWIGTIEISGAEFRESLRNHVYHYAGDSVKIAEKESAENISQNQAGFIIKTNLNSYSTRTIFVATGSKRRKLEIPGAEKFEGKGIVYCASCDGPLFVNQDVAVIGGGNAATETALQLLAYCKSVTLLDKSQKMKADPITIGKILKNPKVKIIQDVDIKEIKGDQFVSSIVYQDQSSKKIQELPVSGIFVEIGLLPATNFIQGLVEINEYNQIKVDPRNQRTSLSGIWAAGDCTDGLFHQNNIAAGDAIKAIEDIYLELQGE